jgi:chromate transporter
MAEEQVLQASDVIPEKKHVPLGDLALFFLRLGTTAFGGPAAHVAIMEDELVRRRHWLSREKFLDLLGASNLIPGPSSSEVAIHIGYLCAGWRGDCSGNTRMIAPTPLGKANSKTCDSNTGMLCLSS